MSVIVKGMNMPKSCFECQIYCKEFNKSYVSDNNFHTKRLKNCPLVELPEKHGRLIDADKLKEWWLDSNYFHEYTYFGFMDSIDDAETIIESEE